LPPRKWCRLRFPGNYDFNNKKLICFYNITMTSRYMHYNINQQPKRNTIHNSIFKIVSLQIAIKKNYNLSN